MTRTAASGRKARPSLEELRQRQHEDREGLPKVGAWVEENPPWLTEALSTWLTRLIEEKEYLLGFAELGARLGDTLEDVMARLPLYEADLRRREDELGQAHARVVELEAELARSRSAEARLQAEVARLRAAGDEECRAATPGAARDGTAARLPAMTLVELLPEHPPAMGSGSEASPLDPPSLPPPSIADAVVRTFVAWCRGAGMLAGRVPQFAERLRAVLPHAAVAAVYRDLDSAVRPVAFTRGPEGAAPAEYWLVEVEGGNWLLPQPQSPHQFRDLAPVFEGAAAPKDLTAIRPARVRSVGSGFEVEQAGIVG